MALELEYGTAVDIRIGPVFNTADNSLSTGMAYDDAGLEIHVGIGTGTVQVTTSASSPALSGTTDADWWFRAETNRDGYYLLRVPASFTDVNDAGEALVITGLNTGVYGFRQYESVTVIDPALSDDLATIIGNSTAAVGLAADVVNVTAAGLTDIVTALAECDYSISGGTLTISHPTYGTLATKDVTLASRDPITVVSEPA